MIRKPSGRRVRRAGAALVLSILLAATAQAQSVTARPPSGPLIGAFADTDREVTVFKGTPYAVPPVGVRRWRDAEPITPWTEPRLADRFGPDCTQSSTMDVLDDPASDFWYHPPSLTSEDCLHLNVWAPAKRPAGGLPVMVWIHGGGEVQGAGSWPLYDGARLARKGVVVVTLNYRLGIFGRFAHPELSEEGRRRGSGDYDLSDMVQALTWVKRNIAAFGGDPGNVTIFGQSSGATYVAALMASPPARGLFHCAIGQSGAAFRGGLTPLKTAEAEGVKFARGIGRPHLAQLREMTASELHALERRNRYYLAPVIDGHYLPITPCEAFASGRHNSVPLLVGLVAEEHFGYKPPPPAFADRRAFTDYVAGTFPQMYADPRLAGRFSALLPPSRWSPASAYNLLRGYGVTGWEVESWAAMNRSAAANTYLYYFTQRPPGQAHAFHTGEVSYVFDNERASARYSPNMTPAPPTASDLRLADEMSDYWVAFARTGSPNGPGRPAWRPYADGGERPYMEFGQGRAQPRNRFLSEIDHRPICDSD